MTVNFYRARFIPQVVAILMLLWALNPETPYGYYVLLRIVLCGICAFLAYRALKIGNDKWVWILGLTAVIYNPVIPTHLTREIWSVVNIVTVVVLVVTGIDFRKALLKSLAGFSGAYTITDGVTAIGDRAFAKCRFLTSVTIPDSVTSIGTWAFSGCSSLTSVAIPANVTSIGELAFFGCTSLVSINVHPDNMKYASVGGVLFNKDCTVLIHCPKGFSGVYNIPDSVTSIGDHAFSFCAGLTSVTIPDSVHSIGEVAFNGCTSLASVTIPDNVTSIGDGVFSGCSSLATVTLPYNVKSIGDSVFSGCTALVSVTFPDGITKIGDGAFKGCTSLASITIPASVRSIGEYAFHDCRSLASVLFTGDAPTISKRSNVFNDTPFVTPDAFGGTRANIFYLPGTSGWGATYDSLSAKPLLTYAQESGGIKVTGIDDHFTGSFLPIPESLAGHPVTSIGDSAFRNRRSLSTVTIPASVTTIGDLAFSFCSALTSVSIPDGVISIGEGAFSCCPSLALVIIPASVTSIGNSAFLCCTAIASVKIPASVTNISAHVFDRCTSLATAIISEGVRSIDDGAFFLCTSLTSVTIPASVHSIEGSAFFGCASLTSILFAGEAPTVYSNDAANIPVAFPNAFFNTRAKIYFRPGTSGWGAAPIEKMIFSSDDEFAAYVVTHPEETAQWTDENFEIVPGEAAPATEAAPEPAAKQEAAPTEEIFTPPKKWLGEPNVRYKERVAAAEEGWKTSRTTMVPDTMPGATTAERVAAALEATPESAVRAREEASGNAEASSDEINASRVKETDIDTGGVRYRLSRDIELGLVNPHTDIPVPAAEMQIVAETWEREFGGKAHNPTQLADFILCFPPEVAAARIKTADAIVEHLKKNPDNRFNTAFYDGSMGPAIREAFQARWFRYEKQLVFHR